MYNFGYGFGPFGFMGLGFIFIVLFWGLVIYGIIHFIKWNASTQNHNKDEDRSTQILKERYAKGEIDKGQFEQMKKDLNG